MSINEKKMKLKGESKIWASIISSNGRAKDISSIQLGQQILFDEAVRVLPEFRQWIDTSNKADRLMMREMFSDDEKATTLILKTMFFMVGTYGGVLDYSAGLKKKNRHRKIKSINKKIFTDLTFEQTWRIVEVIVELSKYFDVNKENVVTKTGLYKSLSYTCSVSSVIFEKLASRAVMAFYPMPIFKKPKDWGYDENGKITGGYFNHKHRMIRSSNSRLLKGHKFDNRVFDSLNYIQSQCWRINEDVLKAVESDLKVPVKSDFVKSIYPSPELCMFGTDIKDEDSGLSIEEINNIRDARKVFQNGVELYQAEVRDYESAVGKYRAVKMAVEIANDYKGEDIYFPHSYDSRGRIYPIPVGLSPQGSDAIKAMLEYSNGEVLNREGAEWAFAYLASLYGDDKLHFEQRVEMGMLLMNEDYRNADEPYQFLAHQLELQKIIDDPTAEFKGRIHLDACNSGSQFTSALTNDLKGCLATNVTPTIGKNGLCDRQDAYLLVSNKSIELIKLILTKDMTEEENDIYSMFLKLLQENGRKICKRPVMVSNYGGTAGGRAEMLYDMFRELNLDKKYVTKANAIKLAKVIGDSITGVLNGGKAFEKYIQTMNNIIAKGGTGITWSTGDNFPVVHVKLKELKPKQVKLTLPKSRKPTLIIKRIFSNDVSPAKMRSSISPNYIHSLDAELLRRVALRMRDEGIENSDWIHDSFGCLPNQVNRMLEITKEVFVEMTDSNPLLTLDNDLRSQAIRNGSTDRQLSKVVMPNLGNVNFRDVHNSEWFFS